MLNVDIETIKKEDSRYIHALSLTFNRFNYASSSYSIGSCEGIAYLNGKGEVLFYESMDLACRTLIEFIAYDEEEKNVLMANYEQILKLKFSDEEAYEYVMFKKGKSRTLNIIR